MRRFGTHGRVFPQKHYVVPRTEEIARFINRIKDGKYIVLFAPRQTGKTTFFRLALDALVTEDPTYFPIQLNFEVYEDYSASGFYNHLYEMIREELETTLPETPNGYPTGVSPFSGENNINRSCFDVRLFQASWKFADV